MTEPRAKLSLITLCAGAVTAGAVAAAASLLPGAMKQTEAVAPAKAPPANGGGYQLTEHVKRYYKSTLV